MSSTSGLLAMHELEDRVARVDHMLLETTQAPGASEGIRQAAVQERDALQKEMARLRAEMEREQKLQEALLQTRHAMDVHAAGVIREKLRALAHRREREDAAFDLKRWGDCCSGGKKP
jgi:hypothetical protein